MISRFKSESLPVFSFGCERQCTYCGDPAESRDHVIPVSFQRLETTGFRGGPWTWACLDCNRRLNARYFDDFETRASWASAHLKTSAMQINWHPSEIRGLDYTLRKYIETEIAKRRHRAYRADWYESRDFYLNIEDLAWHLRDLPRSQSGRFLQDFFGETLQRVKDLYRPN